MVYDSIGKGFRGLKSKWLDAFKPSNTFSKLGRFGKVGMGVMVGVTVAAVALTIVAASKSTGIEVAAHVLTALAIVVQLKGLLNAVKDYVDDAITVTRATVCNATKFAQNAGSKAGVVGLVVGAVVTWAAFGVMVGLSGIQVGSMAFNSELAGAIAATVVAIIMFAIAAIPVIGQIIAAVIGLVDALVAAICAAFVSEEDQKSTAGTWLCGGLSGAMTKGITWLIYGGTIMVDLDDEDRLRTFGFLQWPENDELGMAQGSQWNYSIGVTNTINLVSIPIDWKAGAYWHQYSDALG